MFLSVALHRCCRHHDMWTMTGDVLKRSHTEDLHRQTSDKWKLHLSSLRPDFNFSLTDQHTFTTVLTNRKTTASRDHGASLSFETLLMTFLCTWGRSKKGSQFSPTTTKNNIIFKGVAHCHCLHEKMFVPIVFQCLDQPRNPRGNTDIVEPDCTVSSSL